MTSKHKALLKAFKETNTDVKVIGATELVGEKYAFNGLAIRVELSNGNWLRVYRIANGDLNWY